MKVFGTVKNSTVDGKGIRYSLFVQGCNHHCKGCHNPDSWSYNSGVEMAIDDIITDINATKLIKGVTFSGGEPFDKADELTKVLLGVRKVHPKYNFWSYTGYVFEQLYEGTKEQQEFLRNLDVLVDGEFVLEQRSLLLPFRGSSNQRVINVRKTLENFDKGDKTVVLFLK